MMCMVARHSKARRVGRAFGGQEYAGDHLISHTLARAVPSAQRGLTSVFGMGTGGTLAVNSPAILSRSRTDLWQPHRLGVQRFVATYNYRACIKSFSRTA